MNRFKFIVFALILTSVFVSFVSISNAGSNDVWVQCANIGDIKDGRICCGFKGAQAWITANSCPTFTPSPAKIVIGQTSSLSWSFPSTSFNSCTASGEWSGSKQISNSEPVTPLTIGKKTYALTCSGIDGTFAKETEIDVTVGGTLKGKVVNKDDPLVGIGLADITLSGTSSFNGKTTSTGDYSIPKIPAGTYTVIASAPGFVPSLPVTIDIEDGKEKTQNFELAPGVGGGGGGGALSTCVYSLALKNLPKSNTFAGESFTWDIIVQDRSVAACGRITYDIPSISLFDSNSCHSSSGIYTRDSNPPRGTKIQYPYQFSVDSGKELNAFKVFVKSKPGKSCTLSFNFKVGALTVDPSFTTQPPGVSNQPPHISFFDFGGSTSTLTAKWESFYPDNNPEREMKVKCALNCDPDTQNCNTDGNRCSPYDANQGSGETKEGACDVSSPAYDFQTTNKLICVFYDPSDATLKTRINHDFEPVNFEGRTPSQVIANVGSSSDLKIDITNKGLLTDSYRISITPSGSVSVSPTLITTESTSSGKVTSGTTSIAPLVDANSELDITIQSLTSSKTQTLKVQVQPDFLALPEFGLKGLIQIIIIAGVVYFLIFDGGFPLFGRKRRK